MYNFILQIAFMISLGAMIYLFVRAVPRISDQVLADDSSPITKLNKWFSSMKIEKVDVFLSVFFEKMLRKFKLFLMRLDNSTSNWLDKVKKSSDGAKKIEKPSLFTENNPGDENKEEKKENQ